MKRFLSTCAIAALGLAGAAVAAPAAHAATPPPYSVMLLQFGGTDLRLDSRALGVNDAGDVVGETYAQGLFQEGRLWRARSGVPGWGAAFVHRGTDVGGTGTFLGEDADGAVLAPIDGEKQALSVAGLTTHAGRISENGTAVVWADSPSSNPRSFLFTSPTASTELLPPAESSNAAAVGISGNARHVAGTSRYRNTDVPVVWTDGAGRRLTPPSGAAWSRLLSVNDSGQSAGCSLVSGAERPYRYDAAGTPTALPLPAGRTSACATAINNAGVVAGTARGASGTVAVVWIGGAVHVLDDLLPARDGFSLTTVADINAAGQVVGTATLASGRTRGYIATASTPESIYTTPGLHRLNGRDWSTTCQAYSVTNRCRTEIIADHVVWKDGKYSLVRGWTFNNLTYTPSPRGPWAGNPLAETGSWTAADGRKWRTECDTAATGRGGCRSFAWVRVASATPRASGGYTYSVTEQWVFNNIVRFR